MSKRLILILALAFVVGITFAAYAEVQNVKVSGDIAVTGIARNDLTLTKDQSVADFGKKIRGVVSQARVRVDADLTDNVATTVRLLNERVWGEETSGNSPLPSSNTKTNNTEVDLDLAYVNMKEFLYSPLSLTIGRQDLRFGNGLIIGDPDTNAIAAGHLGSNNYLPDSLDDLSLRKAFDAARATLDYNPLVVDLIYSKISESNIAAFDDVNLYGMNASYEVSKNLIAEGYIFQRARDTGVGVAAATTGSPAKKEKLTTVGARGAFKGDAVTLGLEGAFQFGDHIASTTLYPNEANDGKLDRKVTAYAIQAAGSYKLPRLTRYSPMVGGSYTYLSGDKAASTNDHYRGWDPMFEDQNSGTIFNKIFALTNMQIFNLNASAKPIDDVTLMVNYYNLMACQPYRVTDGTYYLSNISTSDPAYTMKGEKKGLGNEIDLGITYDYTEDVQFGLSAGAFIPGSAFDKANKETAKQVIGSMKVTF